MPTVPRGPVFYQCDGEACEEQIEGVPHGWWKVDVPQVKGRFSGPYRHYFLHNVECLIPFIIRQGEAIVRPPRRENAE